MNESAMDCMYWLGFASGLCFACGVVFLYGLLKLAKRGAEAVRG